MALKEESGDEIDGYKEASPSAEKDTEGDGIEANEVIHEEFFSQLSRLYRSMNMLRANVLEFL